MITGSKYICCRSVGQAGANWDTIAQAFGRGHNIRHDSFVLIGKIVSGTAIACLYFVQHHQPLLFVAELSQCFEKAFW